MNRRTYLYSLLFAALALAPVASLAHDDDDDDDDDRPRSARAEPARTSPEWKSYQAECGSCHLAFPPRMLPAASWQRLMGSLDDHFGQNAEVDAATRTKLSAFLASAAGPARRDAPLRITETSWWVHEHDEIAPSVYKRKAIVTPANCGACHTKADQGDFRERGVKIPR